MIIVGRKILSSFLRAQWAARSQVAIWLSEMENGSWANSNDLIKAYPRAMLINENIILFNFNDPPFKIKVQIAYKTQIIIVLNVDQ